jgi:succinate dehydrogenase / fumarate reductase cytochrome b subunit
MATRERPVSPFMIGPYYRPQLTSVLSILHRATGVFLALAAFAFAGALLAIAAGGAAFDALRACAASPLGLAFLVAVAFSLAYHFFNGIRHLLWDIGWGYELRGAPCRGATRWRARAAWARRAKACTTGGCCA